MYHLQSRWRLEGRHLVYYGLRNKENLFKNRLRLTSRQAALIAGLPGELDGAAKASLGKLVGMQVVETAKLRPVPRCLEEAVFCRNCVANDYILPGLEFDESGFCPLCQTKAKTAALKSVVPIRNTFPRSKRSRFDVALFYTGGKDSTYLLHYLSEVLGLRVLALTWEIPFMSESARRSMENAREKMENVEFITRYVDNKDLKAIYSKLYSLSGNTCACPSLAYVLFYPELVANRVPYFVTGNEPVQMLGLYYNHMAPKVAYRFGSSSLLNGLVNVGRLLTLHPPLKKGQLHTLETMKQLAYGDGLLKTLSGYQNALVSNVVAAIHTVPEIVKPLRRAIRASSWTGNIPAFVQVDLNRICGGRYDWREVKETIIRECGWVAPEMADKGLHTSCRIEKCKEHSQFLRFYRMESRMMPFSALEIALASRDQNISRQQAIRELKTSLGFSLEEIPECQIMKDYLR